MAKDLTQLTDAELYQSVVQPQIDARAQRAASTAVGLGMQYNADQYATALRLSPQLGAPPLRLMSDPRALQAMQAEMQAFETIKNNPPLQAWVNEDPDNALLAHDDFGYLDAVTKVMSYLPDTRATRGLERGLVSVVPSIANFGRAAGRLADLSRVMGERAVYDAIEQRLAAGEAVDADFINGLVPQTAGQREGLLPADNIANYLRYATMGDEERARVRSSYDASLEDNRDAIAQLISAAVFYKSQYGQGAKFDTWADFPGWLVETIFEQAPITLGLAAITSASGPLGLLSLISSGEAMGRAETLGAQVEAGQDITAASAERARSSAGFLYGAAELLGPVGRIGRGFFREIPEELAQRAARSLLSRTGRSFAANAAEEALNEVLQEVVVELFVDGEVDITWDGLREKMIVALTAAATGGVYGTMFEFAGNRRITRLQDEMQRSGQEVMTISELNRLAPESKLRTRSPEKFRQFLQTAGMGETFFWVDAAQLQEQITSGATSLAELELTQQQLDDAAQSGNKVGVSAAAFTAKIAGTPMGNWFEANASVRREGYSQSEMEDLQQLAEEVRAEAASAAADLSEASAARRQVYETSYNQLRAAGVAHERAKVNASLHAAALTTLSERLGVDLPGLLNLQVEGEPQRLARRGLEPDGVTPTPEYEAAVEAQRRAAGEGDTTLEQAEPMRAGIPVRLLDALQMKLQEQIPPDQLLSDEAMVMAEGEMNARPQNTFDLDDPAYADRRVFIDPVTKDLIYGVRALLEVADRVSGDYAGVAGVRQERRIDILLGPPAAGKSTIAEEIAPQIGARIVDSDDIKKMIPEYDGGIGAAAVHEESSALGKVHLASAMARGDNIILPKVGDNPAKMKAEIEKFKAQGYTVNVVNMAVTAENAFQRMVGRFISTGRLIPPAYALGIGTKPTQTYEYLKAEGVADGYANLDNNGPFGEPAIVLEDSRVPGKPVGQRADDGYVDGRQPDRGADADGRDNAEGLQEGPVLLYQKAVDRREPSSTGAETGVAMPTNLASAAQLAFDNRFKTGRDFKLALQEIARAEHGDSLLQLDDETRAKIADFIFEDALEAVQDNQNAIGWYDDAVTRAKTELAKLYPELAEGGEAEFAFIWALAVTSNGLKVDKNFELAAAAYDAWKRDGRFPPNIGIGQAAAGINQGLAQYQKLLDIFDGDWEAARDFMITERPVREIEKLTGIAISGEGKGELVRGAAILGPKIGNGFFSNLYGLFDGLTMDRWLMRSVGRWRGSLIFINEPMLLKKRAELRELIDTLSDDDIAYMNGFFNGAEVQLGRGMTDDQLDAIAAEGAKRSMVPDWRSRFSKALAGEGDSLRKLLNAQAKYLDGQVEAPAGAKERTFIRGAFRDALARLQQQPGLERLTMADLQALLWYPEKLLYESAKKKPGEEIKSYEDDEAPDYGNAARNLVRNRLGQDGGGAAAGRRAGGAGSAAAAGVEAVTLNQPGTRLRGRDGGVVALGGREVSPVAVFGSEDRPIYEIADPDFFGDLIRSAKANLGPVGAQVTAYDDYTGKRLFLFDDGASGFALDGDDIISVFSSPGSQPGVVETMMPVAVAEGGRRLDAFNTFLPKVYARAGFRAVARLPFNRDFAPEGWDYGFFEENFGSGEPDIAFMIYDPAAASDTTDNAVAEYDDGMAAQQAALRDAEVLQQGSRGQISFTLDQLLTGGDITISLFEKADASTFMHEASHLYLQIILEAGGATAEGAAMLSQINRWLGRDEGDRSQFTVDQHEAFASAFEGYLMEGKAPTRALGSAFESMRKWLVALYRNLTGLGMRPSDDIRQVFDQILATDRELAAARAEADAAPLFDAPPPGMSAEEWEAYRNSARRSEDEAQRKLLAKTMEKIRRRRSREWAVERKALLPQVREELAATPVYRMLSAMTARGAEAARLDKGELTRLFGDDVLKDLARSKIGGAKNVYEDGGMPLKLAAEAYGFPSTAKMVEALRAAVKLDNAVELETDRRMEERYGDPMSPDEIREEALAAIHNVSHAETTAREAAVLGRAAGRVTRWQRQNRDSRQQAERMVNRMTVREVLQYRAHLRASQKAARDAQRALAAVVRAGEGEPRAGATTALAEAYRAKQKQLLNEHIYRIARERAQKIEKALRRFRKMQKRTIRENIGAPYINTIDTILEQYDLTKLTQKQIAERKSLTDLINQLTIEDRLDEFGVSPEVIATTRKIPYSELTSEHMEALIDSVDNIAHMGRRATGARKEAEANRIGALVDAISAEADRNLRDRKTTRTVAGRNRIVANLRQSVLWVLNADTTLRLLDGGKTLGPAYRAIKQRIDDGAARLQERRENAMREMQQLYLDRYDMKTVRAMREAKYIPELGDSFSKWDLLSMALNSGNADNWERMTNTETKGSFDPDALNVVFGRELTDNDWRFVQSVWDYIDSYWGEISALEQRATGVTPKKIDAQVMADAPDFVRGGYYPIKYDPELSTLARDHEVRTSALETLAGKFSKAQTKHGHTMARMTTTQQPVVIDIGVFERHVMQVIHDLELREPVIQATKVLRGVREVMINKGMQEDYDALEIWLNDVAAGDATSAHGLETTFRWMRRGFTVAKLGFNLRTALLQPLGLSQSAVVVGKQAMAKGIMKYLGGISQWNDYAMANSAVMRERIRTFDKDINIITGEIRAGLPAQKGFERFVNTITPWSFYLMQRTQYWAVDLPTFVAAYERALTEGKSEQDAIAVAEVEVRRAQGSGLVSDRGMIERGTVGRAITRSELPRLFTVLASYMFAKFNVAAERTALTDFKSPTQILSLTTDLAMLFAVEALLIALIFEDWDEDDETPLLQKVAAETGYTMLGTFPVIRDFASMQRGFESGAYASYLAVGGDVFEVLSDIVDGEADLRTVTKAIGAGGTIFHFPSSQINRILRTLFEEDGSMQDVSLLEAIAGFAGVALPGR